MNEEPSTFERKLDAIIKGMERLEDIVETIKRKSSGDSKNVVRNPNFRRNQNQNTGKNVPNQNIRPPFQENFVEGSSSEEPTEDVEINNLTEKQMNRKFSYLKMIKKITFLKHFKLIQEKILISKKDMTQQFMKFINNRI